MNVFNGQPPGEGSDSDVECLEEAQAEAEAKHAKDIAQSIGLPYLDPDALPSSLAEKMLRLT